MDLFGSRRQVFVDAFKVERIMISNSLSYQRSLKNRLDALKIRLNVIVCCINKVIVQVKAQTMREVERLPIELVQIINEMAFETKQTLCLF